ncbi:hypothetical protein LFYK43_12470 [Ligilactobacillus salitolerans]|uniref:LXG domain-containing protein n=2 Tax=Ligilactobacillus salitolerans TaxID=1808352 RepID=A0A401ITE2_9LACO|nr:hypothetical protein LFYK43_12470 [Ligilactobacillus salitolerans]
MKVDMTEVNNKLKKLESERKKADEGIDNIKHFLDMLVDSDKLSGQVKTAIDNKINNHQLELLTLYKDTTMYLSKEYQDTIQKFQATVHENNHTAIIDTDYLTQLEGKFSGILTSYAEIDSATQKAYSSINDLVAVKKVDSSGFEEQMDKTKKVLTNTKNWMDTFNSASQKNSAVTDNLTKIKAELTSLEGVGSLSYTAADASSLYAMKDFKKQVKAEHEQASAALKEFENEYDPANYTWDHWSNSTVGKEVSKFINAKNDGFTVFLAKYHLDGVALRGKNAKNLLKDLREFYDNAGGKVGKKGKYGKAGYRAGVYMSKNFADLLKRDDKLGALARESQQIGKGAIRSWQVGKYKTSSRVFGYIGKHEKLAKTIQWSKKVAAKIKFLDHPIKGTEKLLLGDAKNSSKLAKIAKSAKFAKFGNVATKAGWAGMAVDMGFSARDAYKDRDGLAYKSKGKSVIHAGVDQAKQIGPLQGAMIGAKLGPVGAAAGFTWGVANSAVGIFAPKFKDKIYTSAEKGLDKGYDNVVKKVKSAGKSIAKGFGGFKKQLSFGG